MKLFFSKNFYGSRLYVLVPGLSLQQRPRIGPLAPQNRIMQIIITYRISLQNCFFFIMSDRITCREFLQELWMVVKKAHGSAARETVLQEFISI